MNIKDMASILQSDLNYTGEINGEMTLSDLNFDSLDYINFLFSIEEKTGIKIPDDAISDGENITVQSLLDLVNAQNQK